MPEPSQEGQFTSSPEPAAFKLDRVSEAQKPPEALPSAELPLDEPLLGGPVPDDRLMEPSSAAQARLGFEGLSRLRARHAEVLARISERVTDAARRDELKSDAERLNPDTWVTDAEVTAGLESYETVFESLRGVVGRRRKRRGRPPGAQGAADETRASETGPREADTNEPGEDA
jgi:hypothetical protein